MRTEKKSQIAAGRISQVKRFDHLIEIWSEFTRQDNIWTLEIYGDGDEKTVGALHELIEKNNIKDRVHIKKPTNELTTLMKKKGLYLMTSEQECFPMVLFRGAGSRATHNCHGLPYRSEEYYNEQ